MTSNGVSVRLSTLTTMSARFCPSRLAFIKETIRRCTMHDIELWAHH